METSRPVGRRLFYFSHNWKQITDDPWVLDTVTGLKLRFTHTPPPRVPRNTPRLSQDTDRILATEFGDLRVKEAITRVPAGGEVGFISPMFVVPKADGAWRPVIDLKALNRFVACPHFKMESIRTIRGLVSQGDWLLKLDLKDAYLSVPIHQSHRKYLRFRWQTELWQFQVLPFGLNSAPLSFTKLTKPIVSTLRRLAIRSILYLDDMLLVASTPQEAKSHLRAALEIFVALEFIVNTKKSVFQPSQKLEFLGFLIDTRTM